MIDDNQSGSAEDDILEDKTLEDEVENYLENNVQTKGPGLKGTLLAGLLAGVVGLAGATAGVYFGLKTQKAPDIQTVKIDVEALKAELLNAQSVQLKSIETRLQKLEANLKTVSETQAKPEAIPDLTPLEDRLARLEAASDIEISPETLSALTQAQADGFDWPDVSTLEARLDALETSEPQQTPELDKIETRLKALEARKPSVETATIPKTLLSRISVLEDQANVNAQAAQFSQIEFPKELLLKAAKNTSDGNVLQRALSKHVRVKGDDDPVTLIEGIEADISAGQYNQALVKFESLPKDVQAIGKSWYEVVQQAQSCLLYTSPSPRDGLLSRMPSSA